MSNITSLPPTPPSELRKLLDEIIRTFGEQVELFAVLAKLDRAKFVAYVKAGFTESQALEILKAEKIKAHV